MLKKNVDLCKKMPAVRSVLFNVSRWTDFSGSNAGNKIAKSLLGF